MFSVRFCVYTMYAFPFCFSVCLPLLQVPIGCPLQTEHVGGGIVEGPALRFVAIHFMNLDV